MCVIIAKNKNDRLPTIEELTNCYTRNDDGAGFMYTNNGRVVIDKGYMTLDAFLKRYEHLCDRFGNFDDKCLVVHCRIGTAGTNTAQNTHPYPITSSIKRLHKTHTTCKVGIAHNGIISDYNPTKDSKRDTNDTQEFISTYLASLRHGFPKFYQDANIVQSIEYLTNSKFAILTSSDELITIGDFITHDGLAFSNTSYEEAPAYTYYNYNYYDDYTTHYNDWKDWYKAYDDIKESHTIDYESLIDIPSNYYVEYDDTARKVGDAYYCVDVTHDLLYKWSEILNDYEYLGNDFIIYDNEMEPVLDYEVLWAH